jgi:predicted nucleic acid-binding protein
MAADFCDASGIVKRYVPETGTAWVQALADPAAAHEIFLARITRVKLTPAITRRSRGGMLAGVSAPAILAQFRHDADHQYNIVEVTPALLADAEAMAETHGLRAYDAVQLAVAGEVQGRRLALGLAGITLVSAVQELNAAAVAEGLPVDDPNHHPSRRPPAVGRL